MNKELMILLLMCLSFGASAHEGHGIPGALPPGLKGGIVQEAEHKGEDKHGGKEETELFFEVVYKEKDKELLIYPLTFAKNSTTKFEALSPSKVLSDVKLKVEYPRLKKVEVIKASVENDVIKASLDSKKANRFLVHIAVRHGDEEKKAEIQIVRD